MTERAAESRFSPSEYAARLGQEQVKTDRRHVREDNQPEQEFSKLAEDIRGYLAAPRGTTEEERRQHNERLNRAVLGFRREREEVLAMITDRLIRHRPSDCRV